MGDEAHKKKKYPHLTIKEKTVKHKHPKRVEASLKIDTGEKLMNILASMNSELEVTSIPKQKNPNLISFEIGNIKITWRKDLKRGSVYTLDGKWLGGLEKWDIKKAFFKFGALLKEIKNKNANIILGEKDND